MGNRASSKNDILQREVHDLIGKTGLTGSQIERLFWRWCSLDQRQKGYLDHKDLQFPELSENPFGERIIQLLLAENPDEKLSFPDFVTALARFSPTRSKKLEINSSKSKLKFLFKVYDIEYQDKLRPEMILATLEALMAGERNELQRKGEVKEIFEEVDIENKGYITFEDFHLALIEHDIDQMMSFNFLN